MREPLDLAQLKELAQSADSVFYQGTMIIDVAAVLALIERLEKAEADLGDELRAHGETIDQRDAAEEAADNLAEAVAGYFGVEIGEHSNANSPWNNALSVIPDAPLRVPSVAPFPVLADLVQAMTLVDAGKFMADQRVVPLVEHLLTLPQPGGRRDQALLRIGFMYAMKAFDVARERVKTEILKGAAEEQPAKRDATSSEPSPEPVATEDRTDG